jgi:hypothetical protein
VDDGTAPARVLVDVKDVSHRIKLSFFCWS